MDTLSRLLRLTGAELLKMRSKPVTWVTVIALFAFPVGVEALLLAWVSHGAAVYPQVTGLLFAGPVLLLVALVTTMVSVMALGRDYDLGTARVFLSHGVDRYQFILSKVLATIVAALVNGFAYVSGALVVSIVAHAVLSDIPLPDAAGNALLWRALGVVGVVGLIELVSIGVVLLALVVGHNAWTGMLVGLGAFLADFCFGGLNLIHTDAYRYTVSYYATSLLERLFQGYTGLELSAASAEHSLASPGRALVVLLLYGGGAVLTAILIFRQQDLMARR